MSLVIDLAVGWVNAIIFFLIDVPALWAVNRGLLVLQAYFLYRAAKRGHDIVIARSRMPVVSGDLLRSNSYFPSVFLLINIAVLVLEFFATLGVNAKSSPVWIPADYTNITLIPDQPQVLSINYSPEEIDSLTCRTSNTSIAKFWPVAFKASNTEECEWFAHNVSCQAEAPGHDPMLTASCVPRHNEECKLTDRTPLISIRLPSTQQTHQVLFQHTLWTEEFFIPNLTGFDGQGELPRSDVTSSLPPDIQFARAQIFMFRHGDGELITSKLGRLANDSGIAFLHNSTTDSWFISPAFYEGSVCYLLPPLRISVHHNKSASILINTIRTNLVLSLLMLQSGPSTFTVLEPSLFYFEIFFRNAVSGIPLRRNSIVYDRKPDRSMTVITSVSVVLYLMIIAIAVLLFPTKEILFLLLVRTKKMTEEQLFFNDFNQLSKTLQKERENALDVENTGNFAVFRSSGECNIQNQDLKRQQEL